jgi:hypothetical protein
MSEMTEADKYLTFALHKYDLCPGDDRFDKETWDGIYAEFQTEQAASAAEEAKAAAEGGRRLYALGLNVDRLEDALRALAADGRGYRVARCADAFLVLTNGRILGQPSGTVRELTAAEANEKAAWMANLDDAQVGGAWIEQAAAVA